MTPDQLGYFPCPTCKVLARHDMPHAPDACARYKLDRLTHEVDARAREVAAVIGDAFRPKPEESISSLSEAKFVAGPYDFDPPVLEPSTGPQPVTIDESKLWGGT